MPITTTQLSDSSKSTKPPKPVQGQPDKPDTKTDMLMKKKERAQEEAQKADENLKKHQEQQGTLKEHIDRQEKIKQKYTQAAKVARKFIRTAQPTAKPMEDPNKDPGYLFKQVEKSLSEMGLRSGMVEDEAFVNLTDKKMINSETHYPYTVELKDNTEITPEIADKLDNSKFFIKIEKQNNKNVVILWGTYTSPNTGDEDTVE